LLTTLQILIPRHLTEKTRAKETSEQSQKEVKKKED